MTFTSIGSTARIRGSAAWASHASNGNGSFNRRFEWNLPDDEATTVAGLVLHEARTIPETGQVFTFHGYRMEILRRSRNKIAALRIKPIVAGPFCVSSVKVTEADFETYGSVTVIVC